MTAQETINQLLKIAFTDGDGTAWQETRTRNGKQERRTLKPCEAASVALRLGRSTGAADAALQAKAREIIALAQWHKPGMRGELTDE